jgi:hypothetical protein
MVMLRDRFIAAARDYRYLLERNYPQKGIIRLTGDRYALSGTERTMLYRGITTRENCVNRKKKIALVREVRGGGLTIDGYNVMLTIGNYLNGNTVFISNDRLLRDAAEMHGKVFRKELMDRVVYLLLDDLLYLKISSTLICFDRPVSKSGELSRKVSKALQDAGIPGHAETAGSADYVLKQARQGCIATSDSSIIDQSPLKVFDLARHVITRNFRPAFTELGR